MRAIRFALCVVTALYFSTPEARAQTFGKFTPGFSVGTAYSPDDDFGGIGWSAAGSLEHLVGQVCELRGRVGAIGLRGDVQGEHPKATYSFLVADVLAGELVSPTAGIGLYYADLQSPLVDEDQTRFQFGVNAGVRVLIPYHHERLAITIDTTVHRVFGDGPSTLLTIGVGLVF